VEVHLAIPVEQDLHGPLAEVAVCFPQGHRARLPASEKFGERVRELLLVERVVIDGDGELEVLVAGVASSSGDGERATRPPLVEPAMERVWRNLGGGG
jgi:hypothetical protein